MCVWFNLSSIFIFKQKQSSCPDLCRPSSLRYTAGPASKNSTLTSVYHISRGKGAWKWGLACAASRWLFWPLFSRFDGHHRRQFHNLSNRAHVFKYRGSLVTLVHWFTVNTGPAEFGLLLTITNNTWVYVLSGKGGVRGEVLEKKVHGSKTLFCFLASYERKKERKRFGNWITFLNWNISSHQFELLGDVVFLIGT